MRSSIKKPLGLQWSTSVKLLGVCIGYNLEENIKKDFDEKIEQIKQILNIWKCRNLTFQGKVLICKSLCYSKLYYVMNNYSIKILEEKIKVIERIIQNFIWNNKRCRLNKQVLYCNYDEGGKRMLSFKTMIIAQKLVWAKKCIINQNSCWIHFLEHYLNKYGGVQLLMHSNFDEKKLKYFSKVPVFYQELLETWGKQKLKVNKEFIWNNKLILIDNYSVFYKKFLTAGIWFIQDLYDNNNQVLPFNHWLKRGLDQKDFLLWRSLISACKHKKIYMSYLK